MKKSIILLELIFTMVLLAIIFSTTTKFLFAINNKSNSDFTTNLTKIEFESTKLFLVNTLHHENKLTKITYSNNKLFYDTILLQNNITYFELIYNNSSNTYTVKICINLYQNICQEWIIK
ncbi:hypothetical protein MNB_ARC-1_755 [hydrothermal vent metagenome]|uniref:Uncharacterized protein n=1 Tax=hydrothermal vent metagenome TaxID=652676 RepID=A0A3B1E6M1_9ZZZZ